MQLEPPTRTFLLLIALLYLAACGPPTSEINRRPELTLDVGSQEEYVVGADVIQIRLTATDPDGDAIEFSVADKPKRAEFSTFEQQALFKWDPIPSDVTEEPRPLTFIAEDEHGKRTERVVRVTIEPGNGKPSFLNSSSELYDVESEKPLTFDVEVRDDDSRRVDITMPPDEAPSGATFDQTGDKRGEFEWMPTADQRNSRVHSVTFIADDGDNPPVEHEVTIIFKKQQSGTGPGDPKNHQKNCEQKPPIAHQPLSAQHTLDDYKIEAKLSASAADRYDLAGILWTTKDPFNNRASIEFNAEPMTMEGRDVTGKIANLELSAGNTEVVHYEVCAIDEDVPEDAEGAIVCSPLANQLYHSFIAYSPDDGQCIDDDKQIDSQADAASLSADTWKHFRLCKETPDVHKFEVGSGELANAFFTFPTGQPIDFQVVDADGESVGDEALTVSKCAGIARAQIRHEDSDSPATYYVKVTGADIPYQTVLVREELGSGGCVKDDLESNDGADEATIVTESRQYRDLSICGKDDRDVYLFELYKGDRATADLSFTHDDGNIDAKLFGPSMQSAIGPGSSGLAAGTSSDDGESITHTAESTGDYHLLVYGHDTPNSYSLDLELSCRDNDEFSDNHARSKAGVVGLKTYSDLKACADQPDWYERSGFKDTDLSATLTRKRGATIGDVTLTVYDENGDKVQESIKSDDARLVSFTPSSNQQYYFKVEAPSTLLYEIEFEQQ